MLCKYTKKKKHAFKSAIGFTIMPSLTVPRSLGVNGGNPAGLGSCCREWEEDNLIMSKPS